MENVKKARKARNACKEEFAAMTKARDNTNLHLKIIEEELLMRNGIIKVLECNVDAFKGNDEICVNLRKQLGERQAFHQHAPEFSVGGEPATETRINVVVERDESSLKSHAAACNHNSDGSSLQYS